MNPTQPASNAVKKVTSLVNAPQHPVMLLLPNHASNVVRKDTSPATVLKPLLLQPLNQQAVVVDMAALVVVLAVTVMAQVVLVVVIALATIVAVPTT